MSTPYRIYRLKYKGSYGGSNTQYAGHLGMPIPKSRLLLKLHLFENITKPSVAVISFRFMGREPTAPMIVKFKNYMQNIYVNKVLFTARLIQFTI
jgi:hypothetical protein